MKCHQWLIWLGPILFPGFALGQSSTLNGIEALLSAGRSLRSPMGIVCDASKTLERASISYYDGMTIEEIVAKLPQYNEVTSQGVIVVAPNKIPQSTARILNTVLDVYNTGPATFAEMGVTLWMNLQVAAAQQKPNTFIGVVSGQDPTVEGSGISLRNASIEAILNAIVRSSSGAAWIVLPPSKPVEEAEPNDLWNFVRYGRGPIRSLCCVSWDVLRP